MKKRRKRDRYVRASRPTEIPQLRM